MMNWGLFPIQLRVGQVYLKFWHCVQLEFSGFTVFHFKSILKMQQKSLWKRRSESTRQRINKNKLTPFPTLKGANQSMQTAQSRLAWLYMSITAFWLIIAIHVISLYIYLAHQQPSCLLKKSISTTESLSDCFLHLALKRQWDCRAYQPPSTTTWCMPTTKCSVFTLCIMKHFHFLTVFW